MLKLKLDPEIDSSFQTYNAEYESDFGTVEVWTCLSSESFGIVQTGKSFTQDGDNEHLIILSKEELLKLQILVNQSVELLEKK